MSQSSNENDNELCIRGLLRNKWLTLITWQVIRGMVRSNVSSSVILSASHHASDQPQINLGQATDCPLFAQDKISFFRPFPLQNVETTP